MNFINCLPSNKKLLFIIPIFYIYYIKKKIYNFSLKCFSKEKNLKKREKKPRTKLKKAFYLKIFEFNETLS